MQMWPEIIGVSKKTAAQNQLETAIFLWFNYCDPVSTLALVVAANECYNALGGYAGRPSLFQTWVKSLSNTKREQIREAQNFIKHGNYPNKVIGFPANLIDVLLVDSIDCHGFLFGTQTPWMKAYLARFAIDWPNLIPSVRRAEMLEGIDVDQVADFDRTEFLEVALKIFGG